MPVSGLAWNSALKFSHDVLDLPPVSWPDWTWTLLGCIADSVTDGLQEKLRLYAMSLLLTCDRCDLVPVVSDAVVCGYANSLLALV